MNHIILDKITSLGQKTALIDKGNKYKYTDYREKYVQLKNMYDNMNCKIVAIKGEPSINYIVLLLFLLDHGNIIVPLSANETETESLLTRSRAELFIEIKNNDFITKKLPKYNRSDKTLNKLYDTPNPGLILFTSGSSGLPKAILHNMSTFLDRYRKVNMREEVMLSVLRLDHIGGLNTLLFSIFSGSTLVITDDFTTRNICQLIEKHEISVLPVTPSFINYFLLSGIYKSYNLSSLKTISYGTEIMPQNLLLKLCKEFPSLKIKQTYGLSEAGIFSTKSYANNSLLIKVKSSDYETKIVDNILYIKSKYLMLGYLNEENCFDDEGWFNTQDIVEEFSDDYIKFLGRNSEIINIAGNKVFPAYIENKLLEMNEIIDVVVTKKTHPVLGQYIMAKIKTNANLSENEFKKLFYEFCNNSLEKYQIPQIIEISKESLVTSRFKKARNFK